MLRIQKKLKKIIRIRDGSLAIVVILRLLHLTRTAQKRRMSSFYIVLLEWLNPIRRSNFRTIRFMPRIFAECKRTQRKSSQDVQSCSWRDVASQKIILKKGKLEDGSRIVERLLWTAWRVLAERLAILWVALRMYGVHYTLCKRLSLQRPRSVFANTGT